jgi:hypothetical protein
MAEKKAGAKTRKVKRSSARKKGGERKTATSKRKSPNRPRKQPSMELVG